MMLELCRIGRASLANDGAQIGDERVTCGRGEDGSHGTIVVLVICDS
jgi:hypothetical protein